MTDKHTVTLEYQVQQARLVKQLRAENSRLRNRLKELLEYERQRDAEIAASDTSSDHIMPY